MSGIAIIGSAPTSWDPLCSSRRSSPGSQMGYLVPLFCLGLYVFVGVTKTSVTGRPRKGILLSFGTLPGLPTCHRTETSRSGISSPSLGKNECDECHIVGSPSGAAYRPSISGEAAGG